MTASISLAFIVRSSSIIGWIPLTLIYIFCTNQLYCALYNLIAFIKSGIFVAAPMITFSIIIDSFYYGTLVFP
jgi:hypothetical protein